MENNYLKSLDYQALTFKKDDVKNIQSREILSQLEEIHNEVFSSYVNSKK
jgi:histone deacetylase complex regulatory component SIN3